MSVPPDGKIPPFVPIVTGIDETLIRLARGTSGTVFHSIRRIVALGFRFRQVVAQPLRRDVLFTGTMVSQDGTRACLPRRVFQRIVMSPTSVKKGH